MIATVVTSTLGGIGADVVPTFAAIADASARRLYVGTSAMLAFARLGVRGAETSGDGGRQHPPAAPEAATAAPSALSPLPPRGAYRARLSAR